MANFSVLALSPNLSPAASSLAKRDRSLPANAGRGKMGEKQRLGVTQADFGEWDKTAF